MNTPLFCILCYAIWTLVPLIFGIGAFRVFSVLTGRAADSFPADRPHDGPDWYHRMNRAHLNCVENLPVFAAVVFVGVYLEVQASYWEGLTIAILACRVLQTLVHMWSTSTVAINIRFTFFLLQLVGIWGLAWVIVQHMYATPQI